MSKSILVVNGSPREQSNSKKLAEAFIKGVTAAGHRVAVFDAADKDIGGCRACDKCWSGGKPCVCRDGFDLLWPMLEEVDILVLATPLYWFSFSAQIKSAIDRFYAYSGDQCLRPLKVQEAVLLACAAEDDKSVFDGLIASYRLITGYMKWQDRGVLAVTGVGSGGDIDKTEALQQAEDLGRRL